jgi:hypothetical protein
MISQPLFGIIIENVNTYIVTFPAYQLLAIIWYILTRINTSVLNCILIKVY